MIPKYQFSNVVVVEEDYVGVILKTWEGKEGYNYDVYVRSFNGIKNYQEEEIKHFVYSKELSEEEKDYYN